MTKKSAVNQMINLKMTRYGFVVGLALAFSTLVNAAPIATVEVTDGTVTVTRAAGKRSIVAVGSTLEEGDTISTEKESYARLKFTDGSEVAIRPASSLVIQRYHFDQAKPAQDSLLMRIVKGGMRTVTGLIGKRGDRDAYKVQGGTGTIGIRGTEYVARVCDGDCATDKKSAVAGRSAMSGNPQTGTMKKTPPPPLVVVARIASFEGIVRIRQGDASRIAVVGDALYNGETVLVSNPGSASLIFNDETRVVLNPGSEYQLASVRYNPQTQGQGNIVTNLVKGGMRMVTGIFGKRAPENVKTHTVTATIGIRGTNFDLWCAPSGNNEPANAELSAATPSQCDQALYASTREGTIEIQSGQHRLQVPAGKVGYVDSPGAAPSLLEDTPGFLKNNNLPLPEMIPLDMPGMFGIDGVAMRDPGLYVSVKEGKVALTQASGETMLLQTGETGFAGESGEELIRLGSEPEFIPSDLYLRELKVDPASCRAQ
jgi:hypothetical protein